MSIGSFVAYISYDNSELTYETTGCSLVENTVTCEGENYDLNDMFYVYGIRVYFLNEDMSIDDIPNMELNSFVVQGSSVTIYLNKSSFGSFKVFDSSFGYTSFDEGIGAVKTQLLVVSLISNFIMNLFLLLGIILISTIMFTRYKKYIEYKKIFKLTTFAVTPIALLITFYNIIPFHIILFFVLSVFAYRALFVLNRELYIQMIMRQMKEESNVVESYDKDDFEDKDND